MLGILYYVSSTLNPILYSVMSHRYRRALRDTVCPSRSDAASSRSRLGGSGYPSCLCIRDGRNDGQAACSSPPAFVCELDTRAVCRVDSQRFDSASVHFIAKPTVAL